MKTFQKLLLTIFILTNLFLAKGILLPNPVAAATASCTFNLSDPNASPSSGITVTASGSSGFTPFSPSDVLFLDTNTSLTKLYITPSGGGAANMNPITNIGTITYSTSLPQNIANNTTYNVWITDDNGTNHLCGTFTTNYTIIFNPAGCEADGVIVGSEPQAPAGTSIAQNTSFSLVIDCSNLSSTNVTVTIGGQSVTNSVGSSGAKFNFSGLSSNAAVSQNQTYPITFSTNGQPVGCPMSGNSNPDLCNVYILNVGGGPIAQPLPLPKCPTLLGYSPSPPILGQPVQIILKPPSTPDPFNNYSFSYTNQPFPGVTAQMSNATFGIWTVNITGLSKQMDWRILLSGADCGGQQGVIFPGVSPSPPGGSSGSGNNPCDANGCRTAIGLIPTSLGSFATAVLRIALGISGGIVLILMVIGSIRVMTSSGDPQRVAAGRDMIVAALAGALFIAFSVMIMQFLGTAVVPIPGLTFGT